MLRGAGKDEVEFTIANSLPNAHHLEQETIDRIASGELDIGKPHR